MAEPELSAADEGKRVVTADGQRLGFLVEVRDGTLCVDPDPNVVELVQAEFRADAPDDDALPLPTAEVAAVTDDEIRLQ